MGRENWRSGAGVLLAILGAAFLFLGFGLPAGPAPGAPETAYTFDLVLMGKAVLRIPLSAEAAAAAFSLKRTGPGILLLALGGFFLYLDTPQGERLTRLLEKWWEEKKEN